MRVLAAAGALWHNGTCVIEQHNGTGVIEWHNGTGVRQRVLGDMPIYDLRDVYTIPHEADLSPVCGVMGAMGGVHRSYHVMLQV